MAFQMIQIIVQKTLNISKNRSKYNLFHKNNDLGEININVPGEHNVLNSLASIALGMEINVLNQIKEGINSYKGVGEDSKSRRIKQISLLLMIMHTILLK